jgi:hypothetical protein
MSGQISLNGAAQTCNLVTGICTYGYIMNGILKVRACNTYYKNDTILYKYKPGDVLYLSYKAKIGKLEKIKIKDVRVISNRQINGAIDFIYVDTFNTLYNYRDLVYETDALLLAKKFYEMRILDAEKARYPCTWKRI